VTTSDAGRIAFLADLWRSFAELEAGPYSPLYAAIASSVAEQPRVLGRIIDDTPAETHMPTMLLAAVHDVVLRGTDHALTATYAAGTATGDAPAQFLDFCDRHWPAIVGVMEHRRVQTNECGRTAPIVLALSEIAARYGAVHALVELGASAGLNLLYDRYHLDFGSLGSLGDPSSAVHVRCELRGVATLPPSLPDIPHRIGVDRSPIDATSEHDRRWLLACVWPDTGRLQRTADAVAIAAEHPPEVRRGDMVTDLAATVEAIEVTDAAGGEGTVCVMTSWSAGFLPPARRTELVDVLDELGRRREIVWLSLEPAGVVDLFEAPVDQGGFDSVACVVGAVRFRNGERDAEAFGLVHPHGKALDWRARRTR
jgi:hypothetical protein